MFPPSSTDRGTGAMPGSWMDIGADRLHVVVDGTGQPPVVLTSGLGGAWYDWAPILPHVPAGHSVVRFDRPGLGSSPAPPSVPTLDGEVERLAAVIRRFAERDAIVVAHSIAGLHAEALARQYPHLVRGLVLVDPSCAPVRRSRPRWLRERTGRAIVRCAALGEQTGLLTRIGPWLFESMARSLSVRPVPVEIRTAGRAAFASPVRLAAVCCEQLAYRELVRDLWTLRRVRPFPVIPAGLLTAVGDVRGTRRLRWIRRHEWLAAELGAEHRLLSSSHFIAWEAPERVSEAIAGVLTGAA